MIISNILGGLGNQMFQYALGRAISLEHGVPLLLDVSGFSSYELHHGFELQRIFNCKVETAKDVNKRDILGWQYSPRLRKVLGKSCMYPFRKKSLVFEPHYHYWPGVKNIPRNCYVVGHWLSVKYFQEIASVIRHDFIFKNQLQNMNEEIAGQIDKVNAVSLHIRRGDYVKNPQTMAIQGLCSLEYYRSAIRYIADRVDKPFFFIFSDDILWVKNNLKLDFPCRFVDNNQGLESYNDMRLMSLCKHNIIANSTFSWWSAWLNNNDSKLVVVPQAWLANPNIVSDYNQFMDDLIPADWVRL